MMFVAWALALLFAPASPAPHPAAARCPDYSAYSTQRNEPLSSGAYRLAYQRPSPECRTFNSSGVEEAIGRMRGEIRDPDLFRLFENTFPNTLDTAVRWRGAAADDPDEELAFLITGDIGAMWIRDSASQLAPYRAVLRSRDDDVAAVFRGVINLQARYLAAFPYCNAFQPPPESGAPPAANGGVYAVTPPYDRDVVFTCNFELDDFGAFLQLSHDYRERTGDVGFFGRFHWVRAVQSVLATAREMQRPTYDDDGGGGGGDDEAGRRRPWTPPPYTFQSQTMSSAGTLANNGIGSPVGYTGLVRSPFRPSDDSALFDFHVPANMMLSRYLAAAADGIVDRLPGPPLAPGLADAMRRLATEVRDAIARWGVVKRRRAPAGGGEEEGEEEGDEEGKEEEEDIFAYEVDGFGGRNLMDDANVPSLLSAPLFGFVARNDSTYQATRRFVLGRSNPW